MPTPAVAASEQQAPHTTEGASFQTPGPHQLDPQSFAVESASLKALTEQNQQLHTGFGNLYSGYSDMRADLKEGFTSLKEGYAAYGDKLTTGFDKLQLSYNALQDQGRRTLAFANSDLVFRQSAFKCMRCVCLPSCCSFLVLLLSCLYLFSTFSRFILHLFPTTVDSKVALPLVRKLAHALLTQPLVVLIF